MADHDTRSIVADAIAVGVATGAYGIPFGAIGVASGLSIWQTCVLSILMFTGASQFAFVGALTGSPATAAATAVALGTRNAFYGVGLAGPLAVRGSRRLLAAHLVIDESAAMAAGNPLRAKPAFWATGVSVFAAWNLGTLLGAAGAGLLNDPAAFGLDMAAPAAFVALLSPRMRGARPWGIAGLATLVALAAAPFVPAGFPVLVAGAAVLLVGMALKAKGGAASSDTDAESGRAETEAA